MNRRGFLKLASQAIGAVSTVGVFGLPETKAASGPTGGTFTLTSGGVTSPSIAHDALIPELWARDALSILKDKMVTGGLIRKDFG